MPYTIRLVLSGVILVATNATSQAQSHSGNHHGEGSHANHGDFSGSGQPPIRVSPIFLGFGPVGYFGPPLPPPYVPGISSVFPPFSGSTLGPYPAAVPPGQEGPGGLMLPHPSEPRPRVAPVSAKKTNPTRAEELIEVGDRSFRGKNYRRAEDRYHLAAKADDRSPWPYVRLSQVAVVRGDYNKAAGYLRDAVAMSKGVGWLLQAPDIQSMFGEPSDFAKQIAHLESHLQAHPRDRNAWFVLGVENYFSGRPRLASDAFLRLTDRSPDEALSAFLDASTVAGHATGPPGATN